MLAAEESRHGRVLSRLREAGASRWRAAAVATSVAVVVDVAGRFQGSYEASQWPLLGLGLVSAVWLLAAARCAVTRAVAGAAAALTLLGGWMAASVAWGGVPGWAWTSLDQSLLAAAALLAGAFLGRYSAGALVLGVLAGLVAQAVEILSRVALSGAATGWFHQRVLQGPVGYHNAQGAVFAVGVPLAVGELASAHRARRIAGALAATALVAALLLTQSRSALGAAALVLVAQLAFHRELRLVLRVIPVVAAAGILLWRLGEVDASLFQRSTAVQIAELRRYVLAAAGCAAVAALAGWPRLDRLRLGARARLAVAVLCVCAVGGAAVVERGPIGRTAATLSTQLRNDATPATAPGTTRFVDISLNGRLEAWRVALRAFAASPVDGEGEGGFARTWTRERSSADLYIIQPHSLEVELLSETGVVGLGLFCAFVGLLFAALARSRDRRLAAAAAGSFLVLLAQTSVDWTWSFPGLVAPVLLAAGAVAGSVEEPRSRSMLSFSVTGVAALAAVAAFAAPYLADRARQSAAGEARRDPGAAWSTAARAHRLNPWDPAVVELQAQLAAAAGHNRLAAERFRLAARLSSHPWLDEYRAAQVLARAGERASSRLECRAAAAANPLEPIVHQAPCAS